MANRHYSSRSRPRPFSLVRSTLFILLTQVVSSLAHAVIVFNTPEPGSVTSCASLLASWTVLVPEPDLAVETAINRTYIGIWATNVGVDQTPIQSTPTNPNLVGRRAKWLQARQEVAPAPVTTNVTVQPIPLISGNVSATGDRYTWTPVTLPPNQYYVMHLQSIPVQTGEYSISARTDKFFVQEGASTSCVAGIIPSMTVTSSAAAETSTAATPGPNDIITAQKSTKKTGAIVGGVLGAVGLTGLLIFLALLFMKRRRTGDKQDLGDFLASRGVNPYGKRSLTTIEKRTSGYEPTKFGGILAAIGIGAGSSDEKDPSRSPRLSGGFYPRRSTYYRQPEDNAGAAGGGARTSTSKFRSTDMADLTTMLAADPAQEKTTGEKGGARRSGSSSITTFTQSASAVPYHPYNSAAATATANHDDGDGDGVVRGSSHSHGARGSSLSHHGRPASVPMSSRTSEGIPMSSISHPYSAAALAGAAAAGGRQEDHPEPEVMAWTGPTHTRASTAMSGVEPTGGEPRSSEGGGSAESAGGAAALSPDQQGATLTRKKSNATSHKTQSTKTSVTRKKAPELPAGPAAPTATTAVSGATATAGHGDLDGSCGIAPPPSAYFNAGHGYSTTTVNTTGASAYAPSQAPREPSRDRRSGDLMTYQAGRQSSEVFGPGTSPPGPSGAFDAFAGAKDGPVHLLVPDLPPNQAQ